MFEDYVAPVDESALPKITKKATEAVELSRLISEQEESIKDLKARLLQVTRFDLPELMSNANVSKLSLEDGTDISIQDFISATIPKDEIGKRKVFDWLADNEGSSIIKSEVKIPFGKSEHNMALNLKAELEEKGLGAEIEEKVHHQTFLAFLRERMSEGQSMPDEKDVNLYIGKVAKIK